MYGVCAYCTCNLCGRITVIPCIISRHMVVCQVAQEAGVSHHEYIDRKKENVIFTPKYVTCWCLIQSKPNLLQRCQGVYSPNLKKIDPAYPKKQCMSDQNFILMPADYFSSFRTLANLAIKCKFILRSNWKLVHIKGLLMRICVF